MSLDWSIKNVPDYEAKKDKHGKNLDILIWTAMLVDLGNIQDKNLDEWKFRLAYLNQIGYFMGVQHDDNRQVIEYNVGMDVVEDFIGLTTNIGNQARKTWMRKMSTIIENTVNSQLKR